MVPLPKKANANPQGESRTQAVHKFSLHSKDKFKKFAYVIEEYFELENAEIVPESDLQKPLQEAFYMPMHAVRKDKAPPPSFASSLMPLLNQLLVCPLMTSYWLVQLFILHSLMFHSYRITIAADISKMYRAIEFAPSDKDLH